MTKEVVRDVILKALKEVGIGEIDIVMPYVYSEEEAIKLLADSWLKYAQKNGLSEEDLFKELLEAFSLMKDFYFDGLEERSYYVQYFTPKGYGIAKLAKELGIDEIVQRLSSAEAKWSFKREEIENWIRRLASDWDKELLISFYITEGGEKYVPLYAFEVPYLIGYSTWVRLSKEAKEVVEEVAKEEGVSDKLLMGKVELHFEKEIEAWIMEYSYTAEEIEDLEWKIENNKLMLSEETDEEEKKELENEIEELKKRQEELREKLRKMLEEAKEGLIKKVFAGVSRDTYYPERDELYEYLGYEGVVYTEKENWEKVREWLKERVRQIAREEIKVK